MASKNPTCPCGRVCEKRTPTCRTTCEEYKQYEADKRDYYKEREANYERENAVHDSRSRSLTPSKLRKYYRKKG